MTRARDPRRANPPSWSPASLLALAFLALGAPTTAAEPGRSLPADGLAVYVEYDGIAAHVDAWKATAAYAMFQKTPAGAITAGVARQVLDRLLKAQPGPRPTGSELLTLQENVARRGLAIGLYEYGENGVSCIVVLPGLGAGLNESVGWLALFAARTRSKIDDLPVASNRVQGREVFSVKFADRLAWWFDGDNLIVVAELTPSPGSAPPVDMTKATSSRVAAVIDAFTGKASTVATHPARAAAESEGKDVKGFEAGGLFFIEMSRAKKVYGVLSRWAEADEPPAGVVMLPEAKFIPTDDIPPLLTTVPTPPVGERERRLANMGLSKEVVTTPDPRRPQRVSRRCSRSLPVRMARPWPMQPSLNTTFADDLARMSRNLP